jgi:hypothetical protein
MAEAPVFLDQAYARAIDRRGFTLVGAILDLATIDHLLTDLSRVERADSASRLGPLYAIRDLMTVAPLVRDVADSGPLRRLVEPILGPDTFPVQGLLFDKPPDANWKVPWHQDLTIPVRARVDVAGFGPWSVKEGVPHVQPPRSVLEQMLDRPTAPRCLHGGQRPLAGHSRLSPVRPADPRADRALARPRGGGRVPGAPGRRAGHEATAPARFVCRPGARSSPGHPSRVRGGAAAGRSFLGR